MLVQVRSLLSSQCSWAQKNGNYFRPEFACVLLRLFAHDSQWTNDTLARYDKIVYEDCIYDEDEDGRKDADAAMDTEFNDDEPMENGHGNKFEEREDEEEPVPIVYADAQDEDAGDTHNTTHSQVSYQD
ncbi:uncharacterized protein TRAVEDRAFT_48835 [Trametes versicolor FP-101664 SS1]|uniref:uncharacterized protein n=1 Tax=Trametes versicolor (strain FP-101664) TaxID=717944 RepID=UPI0004622C1E|nr:uncharacterized protein TRAVEDRAFT_48835 [Trametes versicolor FP-101664 SS1]EIW57805.1 hypothetical protein TRAVEDRAFT_48835 [Trametes versicolor FP-101664 SS1]